jgi:hypothetical protein
MPSIRKKLLNTVSIDFLGFWCICIGWLIGWSFYSQIGINFLTSICAGIIIAFIAFRILIGPKLAPLTIYIGLHFLLTALLIEINSGAPTISHLFEKKVYMSQKMLWDYDKTYPGSALAGQVCQPPSCNEIKLSYKQHPHRYEKIYSKELLPYLKSLPYGEVTAIFEVTYRYGKAQNSTMIRLGKLNSWNQMWSTSGCNSTSCGNPFQKL